MDFPFTAHFDHESSRFVVSPCPIEWVQKHHPEATGGAAREGDVEGVLFRWDGGALFCTPSHFVRMMSGNEMSFLAPNRPSKSGIDSRGDWALYSQVEGLSGSKNLSDDGQSLTCIYSDAGQLNIAFSDGCVVSDAIDGPLRTRTLLSSEGIQTFEGARAVHGSLEVSSTAVTSNMARLATREGETLRWSIPEPRVADILELIEESFGMAL